VQLGTTPSAAQDAVYRISLPLNADGLIENFRVILAISLRPESTYGAMEPTAGLSRKAFCPNAALSSKAAVVVLQKQMSGSSSRTEIDTGFPLNKEEK
jgi:hypothetical protein